DLRRPGEQHEDPPVVPVERDQPPGIEGEAVHAARLRRLCGGVPPRTPSAHARSLPVSRPPVCSSASASIAPQPATSRSATETACCTNPETLGALCAATRP